MSRHFLRSAAPLAALLLGMLLTGAMPAQPAPDGSWQANAVLENSTTRTVEGFGAMQGVSFKDDKIYLYGDVWGAKPRVGVIREFTSDYQPTGRVVWLHRGGKPLLVHPTGLTCSQKNNVVIGDVKTVAAQESGPKR